MQETPRNPLRLVQWWEQFVRAFDAFGNEAEKIHRLWSRNPKSYPHDLGLSRIKAAAIRLDLALNWPSLEECHGGFEPLWMLPSDAKFLLQLKICALFEKATSQSSNRDGATQLLAYLDAVQDLEAIREYFPKPEDLSNPIIDDPRDDDEEENFYHEMAEAPSKGRGRPKRPEMDEWCFKRNEAGKTSSEILAEFKIEAKKRGWPPSIGTADGIRRAKKRHADLMAKKRITLADL